MKALKRLSMLPVFVGFALTIIMLSVICPITFVPFGMKPTIWWIKNVIDRLNNYMCEVD